MPRASVPSVTVVIPNWNGADLIATALDSIAAQTLAPVQTIVVDNGSSDASVALIRSRWPWVEVVALDVNRGFSAAVNAGIALARGELVALVNNDIELEPGWVGGLVGLFDSDPALAAAAGKLLSFGDRGLLEECGTEWAWDGTVRHIGEGERDRGQYPDSEVFSVCAAAAIYRASALRGVGPFDERFFAYFEDLDWGFRARLAGWRAVFSPEVRAYHRRRATSSGTLDLQRLYARNGWLMMLKCYPRSAWMAHWRAIVGRQLRMPVYAFTRGWFGSYLRAALDVLRLLPYALRERRAVRARDRGGPLSFPELPASFTHPAPR